LEHHIFSETLSWWLSFQTDVAGNSGEGPPAFSLALASARRLAQNCVKGQISHSRMTVTMMMMLH